jgi:uncharacterized protein YdhG (YjbR/CyaY superfamily)
MMRTKAKARTIEQYIENAADQAQPLLRDLLECLRKAAPGASEAIKWNMPAMSYQRILFQFAAYKNHLGFYPTPAAIEAFKSRLGDFETGKASIRFPFDAPLPVSLITEIAEYRVREVRENDAKWM